MRGGIFRSVVVLLFACLAWTIGLNPASAIENKTFIEPILTLPPDGTKVDVDADRITYDPRSHNAVATGLVKMVYGPFTLIATRVEYNQVTGRFFANGSVEVREPNGNILKADRIALTDKFKLGFAEHVKALLTNNVTITADHARRYDGEITVYEKAAYSACMECRTRSGDPLWVITADKATHDNIAHNIYYDNPRLKIGGVTVAGAPYFAYPDPSVKRRSGWLLPDIKTGGVYGIGAVTPYFWALAPDYDLTFRPMFTTLQGPVADVEWRQALASGQYSIRGIGVHQFTAEASPDNQTWRGAILTQGRFKLNEDWNWGWDGTFASDQHFLNSYNYDGREIAQNDIYATGLWDQNYVSAQLLNFQALSNSSTTSTDVNPNFMPTAMPYVYGEHIFKDAFAGGDFSLNWSAYSLHRTSPDTPFATVFQGTDQTRATSELGWKTQITTDGGFVVSPFAKLRTDIFATENVPGAPAGTDTTAQILPTAGVDMRYPLIANYAYGQSIITPVFQFISAADQGSTTAIGNEDAITLNFDHTSLFLTDRFTGQDRFEGGTRANIGMTYAFLGANGGFIRASAGESIHIAGQNSFVAGSGLSGEQSDWVASAVVQPWDNFSLSYEARVLNDLSALDRQEALASLTFDSFSTNLGYLSIAPEAAYGRPKAEDWVEGDAKIKLSGGWNVFGGLAYDFNASAITQKTVGLEFDCQCMNFKVAYTGTYNPTTFVSDNRVMLSLELATIGKASVNSGF